MKLEIIEYPLEMAFPAGTSRGVLQHRTSWFFKITANEHPGVTGVGEASPIWGLTPEKEDAFRNKLEEIKKSIGSFDHHLRTGLAAFPSVRFALETALIDFMSGGKRQLFESEFTRGKYGIPINGLVWMSDAETMWKSAQEKMANEFSCIKIKIGAVDWQQEKDLLTRLRNMAGNDLEIRVDANGAFNADTALRVAEELAALNVHSIEQPIAPGNLKQMEHVISASAVPVALDEELIYMISSKEKEALVRELKPQYLVLKPGLLGGFSHVREWISIADKYNAGWWITSALETNVGLNAIAQFTATLKPVLPQGLGTGQIYKNNLDSPLKMSGNTLFYKADGTWDLSALNL